MTEPFQVASAADQPGAGDPGLQAAAFQPESDPSDVSSPYGPLADVRAVPRQTAWQEIAQVFSWDWAVWTALTILAFVSRFWNLGARVMSHDESLHVYYSWLLASGGGYTHNPMMHGPLLFELTGGLVRILGANDFTVRLAPALVGIFIVVGAPQLLRPWLGKKGAWAAGLLLLISPYILFYSRYNRHDIQVLAGLLVLVFALLSYLAKREDRDLMLLAAALAFMLTAMEISFIYMAIVAVYLMGRMLRIYHAAWGIIRQSAELDALVVLATLGAFFSSPIALLVLNPIWKAITHQPFVDVNVLSVQDASWLGGAGGTRLLILLGVFAVLGTLIGLGWGGLRWLKLFGIFAVIVVPLYTTFFTNWNGLFTGTIGSLGYWLSQQGVSRGSQPWYYYEIVFPLYEYLPVLGALAAAVYAGLRHDRLSLSAQSFVSFGLVWAGLIWVGLSVAGEKMPWLSTHLTLPCILLTAWWIGEMLTVSPLNGTGRLRTGQWVALGLTAILVMLTVRTSYQVNYVDYDYTTEFIDYAHGAPGVQWAVADAQKVAAFTGEGKNMPVAYDDAVAWPLSWYLRNTPGFFGSTPTRQALNAAVVMVGENNWQKADAWIGADYHRYEVIRMWWPLEDYKNLTWERIRYALFNPAMRSAVWQIVWNRDYRAYAALTGENLDPPRQWPLQDRMRIYIRKEIADSIPDLKLAAYQIEDVQPAVDAYAPFQKNVAPLRRLGGLSLKTPRNLALGAGPSQGVLYAADSGNGRIVRLDASGAVTQSWGSPSPAGQSPAAANTFNEPWGLAVDGQGNLYVADTWNHRIQKFDSQGNFLLQWGQAGLASDGEDRFWGPRAVAVSPAGVVYVTDTGNKRVVAYDTSGKFLFQFDQNGDASLDEPVGVGIGADGLVYVADTWNQRVAIFSADGHFERSFPVHAWNSETIENKPYLALDARGHVYVTDPEGGRILVFSADGTPLAALGSSDSDSLTLPNGIAIAKDGSIWVADSGSGWLVQYPALK